MSTLQPFIDRFTQLILSKPDNRLRRKDNSAKVHSVRLHLNLKSCLFQCIIALPWGEKLEKF